MPYLDISTDAQLREHCQRWSQCRSIAFDTEFVAEHTYRPVLCLIQVNADGHLAIIDALAVEDLAPFWRMLAEGAQETIVHAGRSELEFSLQAVDEAPARLFDVQIAAGFAGLEYPAGYGAIASKLLGIKMQKHETRTDWQRRPLSERQIQYALDDVRHLPALRDALHQRLEKLGRLDWLRQEMALWEATIREAHSHERWRRVSGNSGLNSRSLAVVRELWKWREAEARRRDRPARRVLRDDLIIEMAKRQSADPKRIAAIRGMERGDLRRRLPEMAKCIQRALDLPEDKMPQVLKRENVPQLAVLGQFLFAALGSICREAQLAPSLVSSPSDVRELIAYQSGFLDHRREPPALSQGWRAEVAGRLFDDLLSGKKAIRIRDPQSDHPLAFEQVE